MNTGRFCQHCGAELAPGDAQGLCPSCLLKIGLGSQPEPGQETAEPSMPARAMPEVGAQFGRYRIIRALGRGGMGVVYEAEELETGRRVALKVLGQQLNSPDDRARFLREGRLAASINHPNCVYVYGTEEIDDTPAIAMELVAGGTLQERVKVQGPLPIPAAVDAILQIISGLEAAQAIGILHRDVKPGNCFQDSDGTIKIGDFGLSISTAARAETNLTAVGTVVGTPAFSSPEQLRGEELNARSDLYAVGVTLFYLLTARLPFEGQNVAQLIANALEQSAPSPRNFRPEIPMGLAAAVLRCLKKQPSDRFRSYDQLRQALAPYNSTAPTPATLGLRLLAGLVDQLFLGAVNLTVLCMMFGSALALFEIPAQHPHEWFAWMILGLGIGLLYFTVAEGIWGRSVGKGLCRLRVVTPGKSPPGLVRALVRALLYLVLPVLPYWIINGSDPYAPLRHSWPVSLRFLIQIPYSVILALLFSTMRRRNGFASVHDLLTGTRVVSRAAVDSRSILAPSEPPPAPMASQTAIGPYEILDTLEKAGETEWLLGYDLRLLRKVWIHVVPAGTPPVPATMRNISRTGRLRWLTGRRSAEENWDAFECAGGKPLLALMRERQPWSRVRYWLHDLAREIGAAERDDSLPKLALDRVWITSDGRAKLLDFPAPGLARGGSETSPPVSAGAANALGFLDKFASAALSGPGHVVSGLAGETPVPLPLHARAFLKSLPNLPGTDAVASAIEPLLRRVSEISRVRRAAVAAGCLAGPVLCAIGIAMGSSMITRWNRTNPDVMELNTLLSARSSMSKPWFKHAPHPSDQLFAVYIASHYRSLITNEDRWANGIALTFIQGANRRFAEQSVAENPSPTAAEIADADAAIKPFMNHQDISKLISRPVVILIIIGFSLTLYVCIPAFIAALAFRGGLVLFIAGTTFVCRDGTPASRWRICLRALVAWGPLLFAMFAIVILQSIGAPAAAVVVAIAFLGGAIVSVALPERALPDRICGTWPVPR